jgi:hypothetical protein
MSVNLPFAPNTGQSPLGLHPDAMPCTAILTIPSTYNLPSGKSIMVAATWNQPDNPNNVRFHAVMSTTPGDMTGARSDPAGFAFHVNQDWVAKSRTWYLNMNVDYQDSPWQAINLQTTVPKSA